MLKLSLYASLGCHGILSHTYGLQIASAGWLHNQKLLQPHTVLCGMHVLAARRLAYHGAELHLAPHPLPPAPTCIAHISSATVRLSQASAASAQYPLQLIRESLRAGLPWHSAAAAAADLQPSAPGPLSRAPAARGMTSRTGVQRHCHQRLAARLTLMGVTQRHGPPSSVDSQRQGMLIG